MALLERGWSLSDGNVVGTVTYTYDSPWTTYTYAYTFSSQVVTSPSQPMAQGQTQTSDTTCTTTTSTSAHAASAPSMTFTPTQSQTGTAYASTGGLTTSPTTYPTSLANESPSSSGSASERGASHSSGASFGVVSPSPALTQALAGSSSAGQQPASSGPSRNVNSASPGRGILGKGAIAAIALAIVLALGLGFWVCWMWRRRGCRRHESSFIQYPFLWRSDAASAAASMSEVPSRALTPSHTPTPAGWHTFGDRDESVDTTAATVASPTGASGYGGGVAVYPLALDEKSQLPPVAPSLPLRFSTAFPLSSPVSPSPPTLPPTSPASEPRNPVALTPPSPAVQDSDQLPSPASTVPYRYGWDHPPPSAEYEDRARGRASCGTASVSVSYGSAMADSEVGSRPPSYSRY